MSSLAHEGNPKEYSLLVTEGTVLSTAQLDVNISDHKPTEGDVVPAGTTPDPITKMSMSCSDVFEWAGENADASFTGRPPGRDFMYLHETSASGNNDDRYIDQTLWLRINSSPNCFGVLWQKYWPLHFNNVNSTAGITAAWFVGFNGVIDGTPRAGPAVWISDTSAALNATLYAAVVNGDTNLVSVCKWSSQSLGSLTTPLFTLVFPNIGDQIYIVMTQDPTIVGSNSIYVAIYDSVGNIRDSNSALVEDVMTSIGSQVRNTKMGVGFVSIGGPTSGKLEFKTVLGPQLGASTSPWFNNVQG